MAVYACVRKGVDVAKDLNNHLKDINVQQNKDSTMLGYNTITTPASLELFILHNSVLLGGYVLTK